MFKIVDAVQYDGRTWEESVNSNRYETMACAVGFAAKAARLNPRGCYQVVESETYFSAYIDSEGKVWLDELASTPYHVLPMERDIYDFEEDLPF